MRLFQEPASLISRTPRNITTQGRNCGMEQAKTWTQRFGKGLERSFGKLRLTQQLGQTQKESESYHKGMQLMWNRLQALAIG
mmetsp:Transcript_26884/g.54035  ORF Transcript_26884/g.54035 Transcript_26884/m.54035 type:complete len:82 (+) Transcript_26884:138-383(+)